MAEKIPKLTTFFTAAGEEKKRTREETEQRPDSNAEAQAIVFAPERAVIAEVSNVMDKHIPHPSVMHFFSNIICNVRSSKIFELMIPSNT